MERLASFADNWDAGYIGPAKNSALARVQSDGALSRPMGSGKIENYSG
jgi:hypothetical protein